MPVSHERTQVARYDYKCGFCGETIPKGTRYRRVGGVYRGVPHDSEDGLRRAMSWDRRICLDDGACRLRADIANAPEGATLNDILCPF